MANSGFAILGIHMADFAFFMKVRPTPCFSHIESHTSGKV